METKTLISGAFMRNKVKIAVIGSHPLFYEGLAHMIKSWGYAVHLKCSGGNEFITMLDRNNLPDIVIVVFSYRPPMNSIETTTWLKNNYPSIPILVLFISDDENVGWRVLRAGASDYILGDAKPDEVLKAIKKLLQ